MSDHPEEQLSVRDLRKEDKMLKVVENNNGGWNVVEDDNGCCKVVAVESSNSAAWRTIESMEKRTAGRKARSER